jgi:hypothetical protein
MPITKGYSKFNFVFTAVTNGSLFIPIIAGFLAFFLAIFQLITLVRILSNWSGLNDKYKSLVRNYLVVLIIYAVLAVLALFYGYHDPKIAKNSFVNGIVKFAVIVPPLLLAWYFTYVCHRIANDS